MESGAALGYAVRSSPSSLDQLLGLLARCSLPLAADEGRRLSAPRSGLPALGTTIVGWLALRRGTDASRSGNLASHASARTLPALRRTSDPPRDAAGGREDAAARHGLSPCSSCRFCLLSSRMSPCGRLGRGSAHVCAALWCAGRETRGTVHLLFIQRMYEYVKRVFEL